MPNQQCSTWPRWLGEGSCLLRDEGARRGPVPRVREQSSKELRCPAGKDTVGCGGTAGQGRKQRFEEASAHIALQLPVPGSVSRGSCSGVRAHCVPCLGSGNRCVAEGQIVLLQFQSSLPRSLLLHSLIASWVFLHTPPQFSQIFLPLPSPMSHSVLPAHTSLTSPPQPTFSPLFFPGSHKTFCFGVGATGIPLPRQCFIPPLLERVRRAKELLFCSSDTGKTQWKPERVFITCMHHVPCPQHSADEGQSLLLHATKHI